MMSSLRQKPLTLLTQSLIKIPIPLWVCATQAHIEQYQSRLDFIYQILLYHIPHCYVRIFLVLFLLIHLIWICFIIILLMHAYLPQRMPYIIVISLGHKTSITIYLVGHRNLILPENSHYSGTLYGMYETTGG